MIACKIVASVLAHSSYESSDEHIWTRVVLAIIFFIEYLLQHSYLRRELNLSTSYKSTDPGIYFQEKRNLCKRDTSGAKTRGSKGSNGRAACKRSPGRSNAKQRSQAIVRKTSEKIVSSKAKVFIAGILGCASMPP